MLRDPSSLRRVVFGVVGFVAVVTVVGAIALWPRGPAPDLGVPGGNLPYVEAKVVAVDQGPCVDVDEDLPTECQVVEAKATSGGLEGDTVTFRVALTDFSAPEIKPGDPVVLAWNRAAPEEYQFTFVEFQRDFPLAILVALFAVVVVAFGRLQGLRALAGLVVSIGIILIFLLPSLIRANDALAVALVAASMVAFAALYLTHGVSTATTVALLGTLASLLVIALLAVIFAQLARLTGLADESGQLLRVTAEALDPVGVIVAGVVIGALGVLDDVTVTQVSAVLELRATDPEISRWSLYRRAVRIGRDHVASTVNTLVLAYVGASLGLFLFFLQEGRSLDRVVSSELVAVEVIRMMVGSIGVVLSVPLTTGLAVATIAGPAAATPADERPADNAPPGPDWADFAPDDELRL
jgi:uncharacterized membrane protein